MTITTKCWQQIRQFKNSRKGAHSEAQMVSTHHQAGVQHLAHRQQEASVAVRLVHQDRSQVPASINNQLQALEAHRTLINQLEVNQYSQAPHQQMPQVGQMY
jgi:hypothetical protein